ncbi:phosphotransferase [Streptomyces xanthochromogenes]|uniref:phosphotransferase n=1 Tax=Streptomyces xanthochromogenes TaxID=67384 RepID=UPI00342610BA
MTDETLRDHVLLGALPDLATAFGLPEAREHRFLAEGLMNLNWRIDTEQASYAVKRITDVPVAKVRRNLGVLSHLAADGLPVPAPLATPDGTHVVEVAGHHYCVFPWVDGGHVPGINLTAEQAHELGVLLARLHESLKEHGPGPLPEQPPTAKVTAPDQAAATADRLLALMPPDSADPFDRTAARALEERKILLDKHADAHPAGSVPAGPYGWTHGDFQYRNLLWADAHVVAILDWDRLAVRPYAEEVARTAQVQFGVNGRFDLERIAAFVAGYRSLIPLTAEELADGVERLWWKRMTDFWQLEFHYDRADTSCDDLFLADEELLVWWTGHRDDVRAAFRAM